MDSPRLLIDMYYGLRRLASISLKEKKEYLADYSLEGGNLKGINVIGYINGVFGIGEAARCILKALYKSEIPFSIVNIVSKEHQTQRYEIFPISNTIKYNINLFCVNAEQAPYLKMKYKRAVWKSKYNIAFWFWELPEFPDQWAKYTRYFNEIWVASDFVYKAVSLKSKVTVTKIPLPMSFNDELKYDREYFELDKKRFTFLFIYDELSYKMRKNPEAIIEAFKQAFKKDEEVQLIIKVANINRDHIRRKYYNELQENSDNIKLINRDMDKEEINSLINCCDVYVSLHRSEGWGLTLAEAMFCGKPVIATNWSGNVDFMNVNNSCPVDYELIPVKISQGPYQSDQIWADPNILQAAEYMKKLYNDQDYYRLVSINAKETMRNAFSSEKIAKIIEKRINEIHEEKRKG